MNILDYIDWRGDIDFSYSPFNEVDALILSELSYLKYEDIIQADFTGKTLTEVFDRYTALKYSQMFFGNDPLPLLEKAAKSKRLADVKAFFFINENSFEKEFQFSAVSFKIPTGEVFVCFRGTDNTIAGWREDFNFSIEKSTPGQLMARDYLNDVAKNTDSLIYVGGHSKGGNFAIYASAFADEKTKKKIKTVYSFDSPGFNKLISSAEEYKINMPKVKKFVPESSVVGIILSGNEKPIIIKNDEKGIEQHNPYSWRVLANRLEPAKRLSHSSVFMDRAMRKWVESLSQSQIEAVAKILFDTAEKMDITTVEKLDKKKLEVIKEIIMTLSDKEDKTSIEVRESLKLLLVAGKSVIEKSAKNTKEKAIRKLKK